MNARTMLCLVALSCGLRVSPADILDDVGIAPVDFVRAGSGARPGEKAAWEGFPLSEAHLEELEKAQSGPGMGGMLPSWASLFEVRGDFDKALLTARGMDKVRLLARAGRAAEASAAFTEEMVASLSELEGARASEALQAACRPMEDAAAWEQLGAFLAVVEGKLTTAAWKSAVWSEELDVAWHRDEVAKLLAETADKDPFKRCVLHSRLGNTKERESLIAPLAARADAATLLDMMEILPASGALEMAGIELWKRADLPMPQRQRLCGLLDGMVAGAGFEALLADWIGQGGDATPLAGVLWEKWIGTLQDHPPRQAILEKLVQRWPDEPRFAILLGRFLIESAPERAVGLFEKAARGPFVQVVKPDAYQWNFDNLRMVNRGVTGDPTYVALGYLGMMQRQDRIQVLLGGRQDFGALPDIDRARYLAAARLDHEFVRTVLEADPAKTGNEALTELLVRMLKERGRERIIPPETLVAIVKKFPELVLGGLVEKEHRASQNARELFEVFTENKVDPALLKEATARLMEGIRERVPDQERSVGFWLRTVSKRAPGYKDTVPPEPAAPQARVVEMTPESRAQREALKAGMDLQLALELFPMPEIRRIGSGFPENPAARARMGYSARRGPNPLVGLERWSDRNSEGLQGPNPEMVVKVMRSLGKDHPRRVPAEVMITAGTVACSDEALKAEAAASVQALVEGKKEARGTELFRYSRLMSEGKEPAAFVPLLEDLVKLPPVLQKSFLRNLAMAGGSFPNEGPPEWIYQFIVNPAAMKEDGFREDGVEGKLVSMAQAQQANGGLALEYAEKILDRQLVKAAMQRSPMMARRGFVPGGAGMDPRGGVDREATAKVAVEVLRKQGKLEAWRENAGAKLEIFGMAATEIERWFNGLEGIDGPRPSTWSLPGTNAPEPQQAQVMLREALKSQDPDQILAVFRKISNGRPELIADRTCLEALGPERAPALLEAIVAAPIVGRGPEMNQAGLLHLYFLNADAALAASLRDWFGSQIKWQFRKEAAPVIADQLASAGDKAAAVDVVLRPLVVPSENSDGTGTFPPKRDSKSRMRESNREAIVYEKDIEVLAKWQLLDAAARRAQELGDIAPLEVALLKMAANPTVRTFETEALPLLAELDPMIRSNLVSRWERCFKERPNASGLMLRLLEEASHRFKNDASSMGHAIREASQYPGSGAMIGRLWQRLATEIKDGQSKDDAAGNARRLVSAMALAADDETWESYWTWRSSDPEPIGNLDEFPLHGGMEEAVPPERARQVMTRAVKEIGLIGDPDTAFGWVATVLATGDLEILKAIREKITGDAPEVAAFCSQALGRPAGVHPLLEARRLPGGEVVLAWNLVTSDSGVPHRELRDVPLANIPAMDGKFDLEILAGKDADKLEILQRVAAAPNKSKLPLKVPEGAKYFALRFTEPGSGRPRETKPVELQENRGLLPLPAEAELLAKGMVRKRETGPGGSPAYQIHLGHHGDVEITNLEWSGGESFLFDAWISGGGVLQVEFLDEKGDVIQGRDENPMDAFRMAWQKRELTLAADEIPAETARLRFGYHGTGSAEGAHYFSVSDARILRSPGPALPADFEKLAKVPGRPTAIALSPDGQKIAVGMDDGKVAIADLKSGKVSTSGQERSLNPRDSQLQVLRLNWLGEELYAIDKKERLRRIDTTTMASSVVRRFKNRAADISTHVTDDGKWLAAWINGEHLLLIPAGGGAPREMPLGSGDAARPAPNGIYLLRGERKWELLKTADFAQGQAAEVATPDLNVSRGRPGEVHVPRFWEGRLRLGESLAAREKVDGQTIISLPVARGVVFDPKDGTIYYADSRGNIVRVKP